MRLNWFGLGSSSILRKNQANNGQREKLQAFDRRGGSVGYLCTLCRLNICIAFQYWARFWSHFDKATTCNAPNAPKYWDFKWWREVGEGAIWSDWDDVTPQNWELVDCYGNYHSEVIGWALISVSWWLFFQGRISEAPEWSPSSRRGVVFFWSEVSQKLLAPTMLFFIRGCFVRCTSGKDRIWSPVRQVAYLFFFHIGTLSCWAWIYVHQVSCESGSTWCFRSPWIVVDWGQTARSSAQTGLGLM